MAESSTYLDQRRPFAVQAVAFMIAGLPLRLLQFVLIVAGGLIGLATVVIWIGLPILLGTTMLVRRLGDLERRWVRTLLGVPLPDAERLPAEGTLLRRWRVYLVDSTTWRDLAYLLICFPLGVLEFAVGLTSIILLPMAIWVVPWIGWAHGRLAMALLGPDRKQRLEDKAERLQSSRARGVDAAEAERRRIERDLHDGAQQRLVAYLLKERIADVTDFLDAVRRVASGGTTIANTLAVSHGAVEKHIGNIFAKLGLEAGAEEHRRVRAVLTYLGRT